VTGPQGDGLTDSSHAEDAERLAGDIAAQHLRRRPSGPLAGSQPPVSFNHPPGYRKQQCPGEIRRGVGEDIGCVADNDPSLTGGGDIDVVIAHCVVGDDLETGGVRQQGRVHMLGKRRNHGVRLGKSLL
jgi:hypothetical protein